MGVRLFALVLAIVGVAGMPLDHALAQTQLQRLRDACIATDMNHESFQRAFAGRGFEPLLPVGRPSGWMSGYQDGSVQIVMEGRLGSPDATRCSVLDRRPAEGWRSEVERLAQDLDLSPVASDPLPDAIDSRSWTAAGERPLTLHYEVYREAVVVRFAKPPATSQ
jgi:hypothetical protein